VTAAAAAANAADRPYAAAFGSTGHEQGAYLSLGEYGFITIFVNNAVGAIAAPHGGRPAAHDPAKEDAMAVLGGGTSAGALHEGADQEPVVAAASAAHVARRSAVLPGWGALLALA